MSRVVGVEELCASVASLGLPWSNGDWRDERPAPPFVTLTPAPEEVAWADNAAWARLIGYDVTLYSRRRDREGERALEAALDALGLPWTRDVYADEGEALVETTYGVYVYED